MMIALIAAAVSTVGVGVCHYYNGDEWNYGFGLLFFAALPFGGLIEEGLGAALLGYTLGALLLIWMTVFAYVLEYHSTGEWKPGV